MIRISPICSIKHEYENIFEHENSINTSAKPATALNQKFSHLQKWLPSNDRIMANWKSKTTCFHSWGCNKWVNSSKVMMMSDDKVRKW